MPIDVISWTQNDSVRFLDQTRLPDEEVYEEVSSIDGMIEAIHALRIRGAPLIGIGAAMGLATAAARVNGAALTMAWIDEAAGRLSGARPTAVNLMWALERMRSVAQGAFAQSAEAPAVVAELKAEAQSIWDEDAAMCRAIGETGAQLIPQGATVMTHCNAGALATGGIGTALGAIYVAHEQGKKISVVSCETRPLRQGARLTAWELAKAGVPVTSIADSAAAMVLASGKIDVVITGADRIAADGAVANKIGTYGLAVLANAHSVPFYVAAPRSTFDRSLPSGDAIPIEERSASEIDPAPGAQVYNPAFDVTPPRFVAGIVTDRGLVEPPYQNAISKVFE